MKYTCSLLVLFLTFTLSQSQEIPKWNIGFYAHPNLADFEFRQANSSSISELNSKDKISFGFGNMFLYDFSKKLKFSSTIGLEFYETKLLYIKENVSKKEGIELAVFSLSLQTDYYPLPINLNFLVAYMPKLLLTDKESVVDKNINLFDHSIEVGLGYNIKIKSLFNLHPSLRYSFGLSNVWKTSTNELGQQIQSLNLNSLKFVVSFYAPLGKELYNQNQNN